MPKHIYSSFGFGTMGPRYGSKVIEEWGFVICAFDCEKFQLKIVWSWVSDYLGVKMVLTGILFCLSSSNCLSVFS